MAACKGRFTKKSLTAWLLGKPFGEIVPYGSWTHTWTERDLMGRLKHSALDVREQFPIIIPARDHIGKLLVRQYHDRVKHQGRVFTEGSIRTAGYWIIGTRRCIYSIFPLTV